MPTIKEFYENIIAENEKLYENWKPLFLNYLEGLETKQREFISRHKLRVLTYFENMTVNLVNTYQDNELIKEEMLEVERNTMNGVNCVFSYESTPNERSELVCLLIHTQYVRRKAIQTPWWYLDYF